MLCFNENTFPAKDGLQSSELLPLVSSQDSPDSPLESLPIPTSPHISTLPSPIPSPAPFLSIPEVSSSSNHSHHPMTTRSQTGNLKPRTFSDFKLYSTQYPLKHYLEYDALLANETWKLCPRPVDHNVVGISGCIKLNKHPQLDVSNASVHGILLEDVYMEQPKGFVNSEFPDYVCKLNKSLYGLKQAPRLGTDPSPIQSLIQKLQTEFKMKDLGPLGYFLGIQASRDSSGLHLRQSKYIGDLLHRTKMAGAKPASSPCTTGLKLSTHVDWAGNPDDRRSTTGYGVFFGSCLISWTAKKQSVVARSSTEAEYRELAITTAELYWIRMLLKELHISLPTTPTIWCDNSGALALASNPFIGSYDQPADIFTKGISLARFCLLRDKLMVVSLPISLRGDDNHNIQTTEISLASHLSYPPDQLRLNETNKHLSTLRDNP
ncbi:Retrovirus-related Pol polyprotein from transposon RE1 [Vitis vinifera]|uniref:Retrovirus-related Pol polyprotein from transposon RE1 n=1 Tax=Vitis vinifera TaxID=29760 RepID=A0A438H7V6_VITVI|nr:Retrovirus-related Pol polyprotein from transposon RE1 [Vitis vinifera]